MPDPRSSSGGAHLSPRLARAGREPRTRGNANAQVGDANLNRGSLETAGGKTRITVFDGIAPLPASATLADVVARLNLMLAKGKGQ